MALLVVMVRASLRLQCIGARAIPIPRRSTKCLTTEYPPTDETALEAVMKVDDERNECEREVGELNDLMASDALDEDTTTPRTGWFI